MERVRVKDKVTGNILESSNDMVIDSWKANADRFVFPKNKSGESTESAEGSESDQSEDKQNPKNKRERPNN